VDPPEAAVGVLRHVHSLLAPGATVLHLTCLPVSDRIEADGHVLGELDQAAFIASLPVVEGAVDLLIAEGFLVEETRLEHDVLVHFSSGPEALAHFETTPHTRVPPELRVVLRDLDRPVVQRAGCLWRRLRVARG